VIPLLTAVAALLGPPAASAADPAPDPPAAGVPAPDPAPAAHARAVERAPTIVRTRLATVAAPAYRPAASSAPAATATHPSVADHTARQPAHPRTRAQPKEPRVLDVPPLRVDVHRGLGAVRRTLHDDSLLLLAGIALLVATFTAASGMAVALVAARTNGART